MGDEAGTLGHVVEDRAQEARLDSVGGGAAEGIEQDEHTRRKRKRGWRNHARTGLEQSYITLLPGWTSRSEMNISSRARRPHASFSSLSGEPCTPSSATHPCGLRILPCPLPHSPECYLFYLWGRGAGGPGRKAEVSVVRTWPPFYPQRPDEIWWMFFLCFRSLLLSPSVLCLGERRADSASPPSSVGLV